MKRFEGKRGDAPVSTRSGPRARAAQDRKFGGDARFDSNRRNDRGDPYQRAERPGQGRSFSGGRMRIPARGAGIELDPDVARVFRDSAAVNEALRLVIRLARSVPGAGPRFSRPGSSAPGSPDRGPRARYERPEGFNRNGPRAPSAPDPRFDDSE